MDFEREILGQDSICLVRSDAATLESLALVLEAVGIDYSIQESSGELRVPATCAVVAARELHLYQQENADWPPKPPLVQAHGPEAPTLLMLSGLVLFFGVTGPWTQQNTWFARGMIDAQAIVEGGQWWRLITGLTLHADSVHLLGNCLFGGLMIHLLSRSIGYGLAWVSLLCCGALGNALNVLLRQDSHHSVGFSTAVFAVIGLLAALQMVRVRRQAWRHLILPLGAGVALLALLGSEGERTDLGAHLFGFVAGLVVGWPLGLPWISQRYQSPGSQVLLFALAGLVIVGAWGLAWA